MHELKLTNWTLLESATFFFSEVVLALGYQ